MRLRVLGSSAGGGFPQWNCNCTNCLGWRQRRVLAKARTQSSVAVSANGSDWLLINASPEILQQIRDNPPLQQSRRMRDSGIAAALVVDAQIDHTAGLLMLRERGAALPLYATPEVLGDLREGFGLIKVLSHYAGLDLRPIQLDGQPLRLPFLHGVDVTAVPLVSQPPPYSPHRGRPRPGDTIGLMLHDARSDKRLFYAPGLGRMDAGVEAALRQADVLMIDGTFWTEDEMRANGLSDKLAAEMGHLPQSGAGGLIEILDALPAGKRKILIHINNTNPILREDSAERALLSAHGIEVAEDGMEVLL